MSPRAVDWSLAGCVWALFATGVLSLYVGRSGEQWIFVAHGVLGFALVALLVWKLRRVWARVVDSASWDSRTGAGLAALACVVFALFSGFLWSSGGDLVISGYNLLGWHMIVGTLLVAVVLLHAVLRRKPLRRRDVRARREFLLAGGVAIGAFATWQLQKPFNTVLGLRGAQRRFTGSYETGSFLGNSGFPPTSWVADSPRDVSEPLRVDGLVDEPLSLPAEELDAGDAVEALLDCTSGWYTRQHWRGIRLDGIALLPRYSTDHRGGRRLVCRPLTGVRAGRLVEAVLRTSTAERPAVAAVLDALRAEAAAIVTRG
jgi:hypothetical protein